MLGRSVLLYTQDNVVARRLGGFLRATGTEVAFPEDAIAAIDIVHAGAVDLALVEHRGKREEIAIINAAAHRTPVVALSGARDPDVVLDLVCNRGVGHLLCSGGGPHGLRQMDAHHAVVTTEKILRGDIFGLDKYLAGFGADVTTYNITEASARDDVVSSLTEFVRWLGGGRELAGRVATTADELVTNAVYNAPRDEHGHPRYASFDRREKIQLDPWEHVQLSFGSDGRIFGLAVTDWFGALTPRDIRSGLRRCLSAADPIQQKAGGAGLGLYTAFQQANQLVVNIDRGTRTEIIAVFDLGADLRGARGGGHSLSVFLADDEASGRADTVRDAPVESVMVSETMRIDLRKTFAPPKRERPVEPELEVDLDVGDVTEPTVIVLDHYRAHG